MPALGEIVAVVVNEVHCISKWYFYAKIYNTKISNYGMRFVLVGTKPGPRHEQSQ